jgi:hypothetical protein
VFVLAALVCATIGRSEDLLFSRLQQTSFRTVVYEVPGVPPAVVERLEAAIRDKFPQAEVVNGAVADDAVLRQKLTDTFLLVTMLDPGARLLRRTAELLPLKLEDGILRWDDFSSPAQELRIGFIGPNPYGSGHSVVLAFGSIALMNGDPGGDHSYAIWKGNELLRKGVYDDRYAAVDRDRLTLAEATADIREFYATLDRIHPDPLARTTREAFEEARKRVYDGVAGRADRGGKVAIEDLAYWLEYGAASVHDGHTLVRWRPAPSDYGVGARRFPPSRVESENGRFFVDGAELVAVNGAPAATFFGPILERCSAETPVWRAGCLTDYQQFWFWHTNLFGAPKCCTLGFAGGTERTVAPVSFAEYRQIQRPARPTKTTSVKLFDSGKIAHFVYPSFQVSDAEKKTIDDVFREIREAKAQDLVIDLRGNGGGSSNMGDYIFRYIAEAPVSQGSKLRIKVARETFERWKQQGGPMPPFAEALFQSFEGKVMASDEEPLKSIIAGLIAQEKPEARPEAIFRGRLWLLIDNETFSSANLFAAAFRDHPLGKILGYEIGEPAIACGDLFTFTLKNSRIPYQVSNREFLPAKPRPGDSDHGVLPDIPFDRKILAPYRTASDPGLAFTLDYIRRAR